MSGSDFEDGRPSKRRRRDSRSNSPRKGRTDYSSRSKKSEHTSSKYERRDDRNSAMSTKDRSHRSPHSSRSPERHRSSHRRRISTDRDKHDRRKDRDRSRSRSRSTSRRRREPQRKEKRHDSRDRKLSPRRERDRDRNRDRPRHNRNHSPRSSPPAPQPHRRSAAPLPSQNDAFTSNSTADSSLTLLAPKQKPNFKTTGKLAAASNTIQTANQTIVLKYHEPSEARKPPSSQPWRLYVFKDDAILDTVELATQSCWLFGREMAVVDIPTEHPSCSKQHAVIQFRYIERRNEFGDRVGGVKPYVLDLESANGTKVNGEVVPQAKYVELRDKDVVTFGESTREYVVQLPPQGTV